VAAQVMVQLVQARLGCLRVAKTVAQLAQQVVKPHAGLRVLGQQVAQVGDGVEAVVSVAEVVPWGARIECRLDEPAEEAIEIPVDLFAQAPS
jgi:hypothetical protein